MTKWVSYDGPHDCDVPWSGGLWWRCSECEGIWIRRWAPTWVLRFLNRGRKEADR